MTATATSTPEFRQFYTVADSEQACDMMDMHDALVIEVTENGCHVFRG